MYDFARAYKNLEYKLRDTYTDNGKTFTSGMHAGKRLAFEMIETYIEMLEEEDGH